MKLVQWKNIEAEQELVLVREKITGAVIFWELEDGETVEDVEERERSDGADVIGKFKAEEIAL